MKEHPLRVSDRQSVYRWNHDKGFMQYWSAPQECWMDAKELFFVPLGSRVVSYTETYGETEYDPTS